MRNKSAHNKPTKAIRSVKVVMDEMLVRELVERGMTELAAKQDIDESRLMADRYEELLEAGYSAREIDEKWLGKSNQQILAGIAVNRSALDIPYEIPEMEFKR